MCRIRPCRFVCLLALGIVTAAAPAQAAGRKIALLVGVREYGKDSGLDDLRHTENDVTALAAVLQKQMGYDRVVIMTQAQGRLTRGLLPTAANVEANLRAVVAQCRKGDTVLVALTGHGLQVEDGEGDGAYFCPMDAVVKDRKNLLSLAKVNKLLQECKADVKLLFVDACRNDPGKGAEQERKFVPPVTPKGMIAVYSCSPGQRSFESDQLRHGIFFYYLIEGLKGKAANGKGEVTPQGLADYLAEKVPERVRDEVSNRIRQIPNLINNVSGKIVLSVIGRQAEGRTVAGPLVGTWLAISPEYTAGGNRYTFEFAADGKMTIRASNRGATITITGTYAVTSGNHVTVSNLSQPVTVKTDPVWAFAVAGDRLTLRGADGRPIEFKRVR